MARFSRMNPIGMGGQDWPEKDIVMDVWLVIYVPLHWLRTFFTRKPQSISGQRWAGTAVEHAQWLCYKFSYNMPYGGTN